MKKLVYFLFLLLLSLTCGAQGILKPGFDPLEYKTMLELYARQADSIARPIDLPYPKDYSMVYRSEVSGLDNRWDLWVNEKQMIAVISIRATTAQMDSWLENFYAGMIPATGALKFGEQDVFHYQLAEDSNAYVHAGWMIGLSVLAPDIVEKINAYYLKGYRDYIIMGHSQGAAIAYLLRSYLHYLNANEIPKDINYKTYNSAAPKPGNTYYAYDFAYINRGGWEHRVVNTADWVPQVPMGIQTMEDLVTVNPFANVDQITAKMGLLPKIYVRSKFRSMTRSLDKAEEKFRKNLGLKVYKIVNKKLHDFEEPSYAKSFNYVACGSPIILKAGEDYYLNYFDKNVKAFRQENLYLFINHFLTPYYYLLNRIYLDK